MDFEQLIEMLRNPGEDGIPETIYDDLSASYTEMSSTSSAKVTETEALVASLSAELTAAKAHNYDLLLQAGVGSNGDTDTDTDNDGDTDTDTDGDNIGDDDDFFEKKED